MRQDKRERLSGWGHYPVADCVSFRPEKESDLAALLSRHEGRLLARGLGRSYGDAALQPEGVIRTERLNHFIAFDDRTGVLEAQAGVTLSDVMALCVPRGWLPPVIPGTRHVTLGGAVACNVHGKNQFRDGDFAEHVAGIKLLLPGGETVACSPKSHGDLFWATAGGMGMTGVIEEVTLQLKPIASASLSALAFRVDSVADMLAAFEHYRDGADYMVGWIDHRGKGRSVGRGVFEAAAHVREEEGGVPLSEFALPKPRLSVPFPLPSFALNRHVMGVYNSWRFRRCRREGRADLVDFNGFFHPLDAIGHWNRLYGRRGFFQYQCLLPESPDVGRYLHTLLSALQQKKLFSFLAVIKYHRDGKGMLPFSKAGYSLALDFPNTARVRALLPQVDRFVADAGGRVYLAKDALLSPELFGRMYGEEGRAWRDLVRGLDPESHVCSLMAERLKWKTAA